MTPARITYVHHNCFLLRLLGRTFLFDYPADEHLPEGAADLVRREVQGADLLVFVSHSHGDHFNPRLAELAQGAANASWVLSDDVMEMAPRSVPRDALLVGPDEHYDFLGMSIDTLLSNDLGVAFLLDIEGTRVYFGGDLANWNWENATEAEQAFAERFFLAALGRVCRRGPVHLAFSNADPRLPSMGGGPRFVRRVEPKVFVPMHTFGQVDALLEFKARVVPTPSQLFFYEKLGDSAEYDLDETPARLLSV